MLQAPYDARHATHFRAFCVRFQSLPFGLLAAFPVTLFFWFHHLIGVLFSPFRWGRMLMRRVSQHHQPFYP